MLCEKRHTLKLQTPRIFGAFVVLGGVLLTGCKPAVKIAVGKQTAQYEPLAGFYQLQLNVNFINFGQACRVDTIP